MPQSRNIFPSATTAPLADRVRPATIEAFVGQEHILDHGKLVRQMVEGRTLHSVILWGPPGTGKTTLAHIIAAATGCRFVSLSASFDVGQILTKPLKLAGRTLHVNAKADFGEILVEVLDEQNRVIAKSIPIKANSLSMPVRWEDEEAVNKLVTARLRITLKNARLFAIWSE